LLPAMSRKLALFMVLSTAPSAPGASPTPGMWSHHRVIPPSAAMRPRCNVTTVVSKMGKHVQAIGKIQPGSLATMPAANLAAMIRTVRQAINLSKCPNATALPGTNLESLKGTLAQLTKLRDAALAKASKPTALSAGRRGQLSKQSPEWRAQMKANLQQTTGFAMAGTAVGAIVIVLIAVCVLLGYVCYARFA